MTALLFVLAVAAQIPPIPPLPATSWPSADVAEPFARELLAQMPPDALARTLREKPELMPPILRNLGTALMGKDPQLPVYVAAVARAAAVAGEEMPRLAAIILIDPLRYGQDAAFRERMNALMPRTIAALPRAQAKALLDAPTPLMEIDFDTLDALAVAAGIAPRRSGARRMAFEQMPLLMPDDSSGPIAASIFSLGSSFFTPDEAKRFLDAVHRASPRRRLIVLADAPMRKALKGVTFIDNHSRPFTPWTRDPFIVARSSGGGVVFINSPNVQKHRDEDRNMTRAIVQELPPALDTAWKQARWTIAPLPFHNGHILLTPSTVWISIHTVEARALSILGVDHVPTETFPLYLDAVRRAASELRDFYHRPVRFVHPLSGPDLAQRLGGGAGIDLDSVLTILPNGNALVGDINLGVTAAQNADWSTVRRAYKFRNEPRQAVIDAQSHMKALQGFLDEIAAELSRDGMTVRRLPLLNVPASLLDREDIPEGFEFLMTWNNVVLEKQRAEGFASLLTSADLIARKTFAASGYKLVLFPPLVNSIVLGGGYRCASNHVRPR